MVEPHIIEAHTSRGAFKDPAMVLEGASLACLEVHVPFFHAAWTAQKDTRGGRSFVLLTTSLPLSPWGSK